MHGADAWSRAQKIYSFLIGHLGDQCFCPQNWAHGKKTRAWKGKQEELDGTEKVSGL